MHSQYQIALKCIMKLWMRNIHWTELKRYNNPIILSFHVHVISVKIGILGCGGWSSIPGQSMCSVWWTLLHSDSFPCQYHSTSAPHSCSSTCCPYQKDEWAQPGDLLKCNALLEIREDYREKDLKYFVSVTGHVMAEVVSCWPVTTEALVWSQVSLCGIVTHFSPITFVFHCQYYSAGTL